jgi:putrescine transport system permease protein
MGRERRRGAAGVIDRKRSRCMQVLSHNWSRRLGIGMPYLWLGFFFLLPFLIVLKISLSEPVLGQPPYQPLTSWTEDTTLLVKLNLGNLALVLQDPLYRDALLNSIEIAFTSTMLCLLLGYPMAYSIATANDRWRHILLMMIILPFWTSFLIRVYAWISILKPQGFLNDVLLALGIIDQPLSILHTPIAIYIGIVYSYLPFMVLPLYANLARLDRTLLEAAADLGARPAKAFLRITLPLSLPGIIAGSMLVFIPAVGEFVIPDLLGGADSLMIGKLMWTEFFANKDWPLASALALLMLVVLVVPFIALQRLHQRYEARDT